MIIPDIQEAVDLIEGGKAADALPLLKDLAAHMPTYVAVYAFMAQAYEADERWEDARAAWQRVAFWMPNSPAVREGMERILTATAPAPGDANRLQMDLDLQAELDAALETALEPSFNPFMLPPQREEEPAETETAPEEPAHDLENAQQSAPEPPAVDAAAVAIEAKSEAPDVQQSAPEPPAVDAAAENAAEEPAPESEGAPSTPEAAAAEAESETATIYDEIEQLIAQKRKEKKAAPPKARGEDTSDESTPAAEDSEESASDWVATRVAEVRKALAFEAQVEQETKTPEAPTPPGAIDDLDRLISELESARILPNPTLEDDPPLDLEDEIDDMVSETMARIYAAQKHYLEAARVYEQLARQQPEQADTYLRQANRMRARAAGFEDPAAPDDDAA